MLGSASLCSKKPLWSYQGPFAGPSGSRCRSSGSLIGSLPPRCAISVNSAKSSRSIGLLPSTVKSVPMRPSSSKPEISWQPAHPKWRIHFLPSSFNLGSSMNAASEYEDGSCFFWVIRYWRCLARLQRSNASWALPSYSELAVHGHRSGTDCAADRIDREAPSSRNPPGQYLSSHMDNTGVCARAHYESSVQDNRNSPSRQHE